MEALKKILWSQFGATIDMLEQALELCTDELLQRNKKLFYVIFHTLIFLDYYLTIPPKDFIPYLPFAEVAEDEIPAEAVDDLIPNRFYNQQELMGYLKVSREKCKNLILKLSNEPNLRFTEEMEEGAMDYSLTEILLYNMRHIQHHTAQINLLLRAEINNASKWVGRTAENL